MGPMLAWFGPNIFFKGHELPGLFRKDTITTIAMLLFVEQVFSKKKKVEHHSNVVVC